MNWGFSRMVNEISLEIYLNLTHFGLKCSKYLFNYSGSIYFFKILISINCQKIFKFKSNHDFIQFLQKILYFKCSFNGFLKFKFHNNRTISTFLNAQTKDSVFFEFSKKLLINLNFNKPLNIQKCVIR